MHVDRPEFFESLLEGARNIPGNVDVFASAAFDAGQLAGADDRNVNRFRSFRVREVDGGRLPFAHQLETWAEVESLGKAYGLVLFLCDFWLQPRPQTLDAVAPEEAVKLICGTPEVAQRMVGLFAAEPELGAVAPRGHWRWLWGDGLAPLLAELVRPIGLRVDERRQGYISSGAFWCRASALAPLRAVPLARDRFAHYPDADEIHGRVIERMLSLGVEAAGLRIRDDRGVLHREPEAYPRPWLPEYRWLPRERDWAQEALRGWQESGEALPTMHLVAIDPPADSGAGPRSLREQWLTVPVDVAAASGHIGADLDAANRLLTSVNADWVGLVFAGDQLAPDATFRLLHAIRSNPQWQLVYCDEDVLGPDGEHVQPHLKPDFNLDYLRSFPYIGAFVLVRRELLTALGGFDVNAGPAAVHDLVLRAWERLRLGEDDEGAIGHVPEVLLHRGPGALWQGLPPEECEAAFDRVLREHLQRAAPDVAVVRGPLPGTFRLRWPVPEQPPRVSIIVPTRNQLHLLKRCLDSVIDRTTYADYEILVVDNASDDPDTLAYLAELRAAEADFEGRLRVLAHPGAFNFSAICNRAAAQATGEFVLLLNNDTAVLHEDWLDEMVGHALRPEVGVVGARLLLGDGRVQHAGVILGLRNAAAEHVYGGEAADSPGYFGRALLTQNLSAVTGACLLVRKQILTQLGGFDEQVFPVAFNDIDFCCRVGRAGLKTVWTAFATLLHDGSASRGGGVEVEHVSDAAKRRREEQAVVDLQDRWLPLLAADPAYNRHFSLRSTTMELESQAVQAWGADWKPRPRVLAFTADNQGRAHYRVESPIGALNRAGRIQGWATGGWYSLPEFARASPDTLLVQSIVDVPRIDALARARRHLRPFCVYELDDLLTNVPRHNAASKALVPAVVSRQLRRALSLCDRLIVSTEPLADAYGSWVNGDVLVVPNRLERRRWEHLRPARVPRRRLRVGWAGGSTHQLDLEMLAPVMAELVDTVDFVLLGLCPPALRPYVREAHTGVPLEQYPQALCDLDLDLALAPLESNPFNEAKSALRLLEYGALGYAVICSDLLPYRGDWPVTRVKNRVRHWVNAIREAAADPEAVRAQGDALRDHVHSHWMLEDRLDIWETALTRPDIAVRSVANSVAPG